MGQSIKAYLGVRFFEKIQIRISESKNGFCVFLGKSKNGSWIHKIHSLWVDSSDQIQIRIFEIHNLSVFLGKDSKKVFLTDCNWTYVADAFTFSHELHIIPCLLSIYIRRLFWNPYLSCFLRICSVCLRRYIFQVIKKTVDRLQF